MADRGWRRLTLRRMMIGVAAVAILLAGWAAAMRSRSLGEPIRALIKIQSPNPSLSHSRDSDPQARLALDIKTQCQLIRSPVILAQAATTLATTRSQMMRGKSDPVEWLSEGIHAAALPDTSLFAISMPDAPRADQAAIVDAVMTAYLEQAPIWEKKMRGSHLAEAEKLLAQYRPRLLAKRKELREAEAKGVAPESLVDLRDELAIREEMARRLGMTVEERQLEMDLPTQAILIDRARPR